MDNLKIELSSEVLTQEVGDETVLLDLGSESYFGLNPTGTRVWQLLDEKHDLKSIFEILLSEYEVEPEQLEVDLIEIIREIKEAGLGNIKATKV